ncbi:hypothetical protein [Nocardia sp. NPDC005825]|uniref:hypothetical protein n=1 Tax=unclassified Nocardia TaxID=2637762 RepID=UPI0033F6FBB9
MPFTIIAPAAAVPMGMDKVADQQVVAGATNLKLTGWTARSGYGSSDITNDELIANGSVTANVRCRIQLAANWASTQGALHVMLMRNTTEIKSADFTNNSAFLLLPDTQVNLVPGDRIWVQITNSTSSIWAVNATVQGGANTYVSFDLS